MQNVRKLAKAFHIVTFQIVFGSSPCMYATLHQLLFHTVQKSICINFWNVEISQNSRMTLYDVVVLPESLIYMEGRSLRMRHFNASFVAKEYLRILKSILLRILILSKEYLKVFFRHNQYGTVSK